MYKKIQEQNYTEILEQYNFTTHLKFPWVRVGNTHRIQGWKLHISTIPTEAKKLLETILPFLYEHRLCFKVIQDSNLLLKLNEGMLGSVQVGKFLTIYPSSDLVAVEISKQLIKLTKGFCGPIITTDLKIGDVLYARYGGFNPIIKSNRLNQKNRYIKGEDGTLRIDSYDEPYIPKIPGCEFFNYLNSNSLKKNNKKIIGPGYLLLSVLKGTALGTVFVGLDLRNQNNVKLKIIKQGRYHCGSDMFGRDMRKRLQHQELLHSVLSKMLPIPSTDSYFEDNGHGYLPINYIEGENFHDFIQNKLSNKSWRSLKTSKQITILKCLIDIVKIIKQLHDNNYIHRDLTGGNIIICKDGIPYIIDLELTHYINDTSPPYKLGTMGYISPNQVNGGPPVFEDDIFSLGCLILYAITGMDTKKMLLINKKNLLKSIIQLTGGISETLINIILNCIAESPSLRPSLTCIENALQEAINFEQNYSISKNSLNSKAIDNHEILNTLIVKGLKGLFNNVKLDNKHNLWLSQTGIGYGDQHMTYSNENFEICKDAYAGIAGIIYVLSRLQKFGYSNEYIQPWVNRGMDWILKYNSTNSPGLYFGKAGIAVGITEAISAQIIDNRFEAIKHVKKLLNGKFDWPDITHGAAGQGLASMYCADHLSEPSLLSTAEQCANYLLSTQEKDGYWSTPEGIKNISGEVFTGFAHGVSGILYFLTEYNRRFKSQHIHNSLQKGIDWLINQAVDNNYFLEWNYSYRNNSKWGWWCHGSPGIALTFLRLFEQYNIPLHKEIAIKSLNIHPFDIRYSNLSQCHGLSGLGEIYLEASRVFKDEHWYKRAEEIFNIITSLAQENPNQTVTWSVENSTDITADLMVGGGGILHFLLRFSLQGKEMGFPLLLNPIK
ncbi:protein kinase/lanthionine synthetase C family protein [Bacillus cereus]|nr:protein kinase/lanthionine synthetase C family protein [Bacillus cereus]